MELTTISFLTTDTPTTDIWQPTEKLTFLDSGQKTFLQWRILSHRVLRGDAGMEFTTISFMTTDTPMTDNLGQTETLTFLDSGQRTFLQWWTFSHTGIEWGRWDGTHNDLFYDNWHTDDRHLTTDRKIDVLRLRKKDFFAVKDFLPWEIEGDAGMELITISFRTTDTQTTDIWQPTENLTFWDSGQKTFLQ
jgi:hypothetical protein